MALGQSEGLRDENVVGLCNPCGPSSHLDGRARLPVIELRRAA